MFQKDYISVKNQIWGDEAHQCAIGMDDKGYYAECILFGMFKRINEKNHANVLNEMFYDYCLENANWMGVS
jgi:hypothetical protein